MTTLPFLGNELLEGERVRLALPHENDIEPIALWSHDMGQQRMLRRGMVYPGTVEGMRGWMTEMLNGDKDYPFAIRAQDDDRLIGMLVIKDIFWQARHCSFFISIGDAAERGRGYGTDAVRTMLKYAFMEMNMHCVRLEVMGYNTGAIRSYEKAGFHKDGTLRAFVYRDGVYYDIETMSILRNEWEQLYNGSRKPIEKN